MNDPPVATARSANTNEDTAVAITLAGTDAEGSSLSYTIVTQPSKGALSGTPPNVIYTPALNSNGSDSFTFRVSDGSANSAVDTVSLSVAALNDIPVANVASVSTPKNTPVAITLAGSDVEGSPLTYSVVSSPSKGILSPITSKCTTCDHFKVHHSGRVFSDGLRAWLARRDCVVRRGRGVAQLVA